VIPRHLPLVKSKATTSSRATQYRLLSAPKRKPRGLRNSAKRLPNGKLLTREYLTKAEVERLMAAVRGNRHGHCDATMVLVAFRHGLRVAEFVDLRWDRTQAEPECKPPR
jgi:integrase